MALRLDGSQHSQKDVDPSSKPRSNIEVRQALKQPSNSQLIHRQTVLGAPLLVHRLHTLGMAPGPPNAFPDIDGVHPRHRRGDHEDELIGETKDLGELVVDLR